MTGNYMNATRRIRSYEISIWTLQDRFLSVLKWANQDHKGQIQDPEMILRDDGTEELSFTIPKYYYAGDKKIENPLWLHLDYQPLEANMHKLKVIFNKNEKDEEGNSIEGVFEFLVTSVTHDHNADELDLTVKAEGLAFHELGKIGYRISLSEETYIDEINKYDDKKLKTPGFSEAEPQENIQYWNDLIFKDSNGKWKGNWKYEVCMDWGAYNNIVKREPNKVYEDEYTSSWALKDDALKPNTVESMKEKWRPVEISESNLYNITQTIAEQFGVFCRYEYEHDDNYQIKQAELDDEGNLIPTRTVIYYNNYYKDQEGHIDLTYPYSSSAITRTVDNSEVISRMYIKSVTEGDDEVTIMDVEANKSKEDYLMNFDYLHEIQAITDEQYAEIETYEKAMRTWNDYIIAARGRINVIETQLVDVNAKITTLTNSLKEAEKQWEDALAQASALTGETGYLDVATSVTVIKDDSENSILGQYINTQRWAGLVPGTIQLFETCNFSGKENQYQDPIKQYNLIYDDEGLNIIRLANINRTENLNDHQIYLVAKYSPQTYYTKLAEKWEIRYKQDELALKEAEAEKALLEEYLDGDVNTTEDDYIAAGMVAPDENSPITVSEYISSYVDQMRVMTEAQATAWKRQALHPENPDDVSWQQFDPFSDFDIENRTPNLRQRLQTALIKKAEVFNKFEKMMGPAMREGYWQPEDFHNYGHRYNDYLVINLNGSTEQYPNSEYLEFLWDDKKYYENEIPIIYNVGIEEKVEPYLTINISDLIPDGPITENSGEEEQNKQNKFNKFIENLDKVSFVYPDPNILYTIYSLTNKKNNVIISQETHDELFSQAQDNPGLIQQIKTITAPTVEDSNLPSLYSNLNANLSSLQFSDNDSDLWNIIENITEVIKITGSKGLLSEISARQDLLETVIDEINNLIKQERLEQKAGYSERIASLQEYSKNLKKINDILNDEYATPIAQVWDWIPAQVESLEKEIYRSYRIGAGCELGWVKIVSKNNKITPALIVPGAEELPTEVIKFIVTGMYANKELVVINENYEDHELDLISVTKDIVPNIRGPYIGFYGFDIEQDLINEDNGVILQLNYTQTTEDGLVDDARYLCWKRDDNENLIRPDDSGEPRPIAWDEYNYIRVFPRLYFKTTKLKDYSSTLKLSVNKNMLTNNFDYSVVPDDRADAKSLENSQAGYYLTLKPEALFKAAQYNKSTFTPQLSVDLVYVLSNTDISIYLDAIKVMKENSRPKVEYDVELSVLNPEFIRTAYRRLNQIVHINDNDLHLEDVSGYISTITLKLDKFWEDSVEIKNYETKFEDLFSTIVAQSEAMKKSSAGIKSAIQAFTSTGLIDGDLLQDSLYNKEDINFQFNNGELTIDNVNGIWGRSISRDGVEGVVAFRGGGIFTANRKDENDNWIWNTGIIPSGINASLITSGQLDTNRIKIYAGDEVKFQLNGNGLFAYKTFSIDPDLAKSTAYKEAVARNETPATEIGGVDSLQYVKYDSEGLALIAKKGTWYKQGEEYAQTALDEIKRVEISWNGLILRNWFGRDVFYADPNTGNLTLEGNIVANSGSIGGWKLTEHELSSAGIRLISGPTLADAGIELNPKKTYAEVQTDNSGVHYYAHYKVEDNGELNENTVYYLNEQKDGDIDKDTPIYTESIEQSSVTPKYWKRDTDYQSGEQKNTTSETDETVDPENYLMTLTASQEVTDSTSKFYVMLSNNEEDYALKDGEKIEYPIGQNGLDAEWYQALLEAIPEDADINDYVTYTYRNYFKAFDNIQSTDDSGNTILKIKRVQPKGYSDVTFRVNAQEGEVLIRRGKFGPFTLNFDNGLMDGKISNTVLRNNNKLEVQDQTFGRLFYDIVADSTKGQFTLKRLDGTSENFNIAQMAAFTNAVQAAARIELTLTINGNGTVVATATSGGGVNTITKTITVGPEGGRVIATAKTAGAVVTRTIDVAAYGQGYSSGESGTGGYCQVCESSCFKQCSSNCQGGCKDTCKGTCQGSCINSCVNVCADGCAFGCSTGCRSSCTSCTSDCGSACSSSCTGGCRGTARGSGGGCFIKGTKIQLSNGIEVPIEELTPGVEIIAYDTVQQKTVVSTIESVQTFAHKTHIVDLIMQNGRILTLTKSHPVLTTNGWKSLDLIETFREHLIKVTILRPGDELLLADGTHTILTQIINRTDLIDTTVYNIDVEPYDTYIAEGIIVHNAESKEPIV